MEFLSKVRTERAVVNSATILKEHVGATAYAAYPVPDPVEDEKTLDALLDAIIAAQRDPVAPYAPLGGG
jgi:hypothetical protein